MRANYTVNKCGFFQRQGEFMLRSKTYYIAAVEIDWDYAPNRTWEAEMFRGQERYITPEHIINLHGNSMYTAPPACLHLPRRTVST